MLTNSWLTAQPRHQRKLAVSTKKDKLMLLQMVHSSAEFSIGILIVSHNTVAIQSEHNTRFDIVKRWYDINLP